jgi:hypothetical protein
MLNFKMKSHDECNICLCPLEDGQEISILGCNRSHYFHKNCCAQWIGHYLNAKCPLCRKIIELNKIKHVKLTKMVTVKDYLAEPESQQKLKGQMDEDHLEIAEISKNYGT